MPQVETIQQDGSVIITEGTSLFVPEKQAQARAASAILARRVRDYFKSEEHRAEFETWYESKYGVPYQWQPIAGSGAVQP